MGDMGRWKPDARMRLAAAALELYHERGFQDATVAEIAERAGLTERTFFRHFADKREVLFSGAPAFQAAIVNALENAPRSLSPIDTVGVALEAAAAMLSPRRQLARQRARIIAANAELQERERVKLAALAASLAEALRRRGVDEPGASLAAETGIAVFRIAFDRWIDQKNKRDFKQLIDESLDELKRMV
jgi:AcrR family transcriptional regulator